MKVPPRTGSRLSLSPIKIDHEVTKALQESITSLLGKRPSPDADADEPGGARARGATGAVDMTGADMPQRKKGKRARPQRAKVCNFPSRLKLAGLKFFFFFIKKI
jgi:DNA replication regulator DPB11